MPKLFVIAALAAIFVVATFVVPRATLADSLDRLPLIAVSEAGAKIADVTIESYGVTNPEVVRQYLTLRPGDTLEQAAVTRDYTNLVKLGGFRTRLQILRNDSGGGVTLHWIVMFAWLAPTKHPFYGEQPLAAPIQGVGFIVTSKPLDKKGTNVSAYSQLTQRADLVRALYTVPTRINPLKGRKSELIIDTFGARGVYRASLPAAVNVYSWITAWELAYLLQGTNGTQFEIGTRFQRSTSAYPTFITAPSVYDTNTAPSRNTVLEVGVSHACPGPPTQWYPPYCALQYRFEAFDAIGGLGATNEYRTFIGDMAHYTAVGRSTIALHGAIARTGGVLPTSFLVCGNGLRGYPKAFCGTDAQVLQAEFRINDATPSPLKFFVFTETTASRVRGGSQVFAPPTFQWHADSGLGVMYRTLRFDWAYGSQGGRITWELQGQVF